MKKIKFIATGAGSFVDEENTYVHESWGLISDTLIEIEIGHDGQLYLILEFSKQPTFNTWCDELEQLEDSWIAIYYNKILLNTVSLPNFDNSVQGLMFFPIIQTESSGKFKYVNIITGAELYSCRPPQLVKNHDDSYCLQVGQLTPDIAEPEFVYLDILTIPLSLEMPFCTEFCHKRNDLLISQVCCKLT